MKRAVIAVVAVVVLGGAFGVWWYLIRDDTPPPAALPDRPSSEGGGTSTGSSASADGQWTVQAGDDTFAGFRITENFTGGIDNTAVMHSPTVTGTLTVAGTQIDAVTVEVELADLESKDSVPPGVPGIENRVGQMRADGLEIDSFPTASFELTAPIVLAGEPVSGEEITADATGNLTVHGETKAVVIPIEARWSGDVIDVAGSLEVALADYGMTPPERPFVSVGDTGTLEFQLTFERADA
jgi:polyisoprenoid-binding protein YceI